MGAREGTAESVKKMTGKALSPKDFARTLSYVMKKDGANFLFANNLGGTHTVERFTLSMDACAGVSRCKKPVYHLMVAWSPKDKVSPDQMKDVGERLLDRLGLSEHQAVAVQHRDTEHPHIHIIINRVHPYHGKMNSKGKPIQVWDKYMSWETIESALRDMEQEYGWIENPGRLALREGQVIPEERSFSRKKHDEQKAAGMKAEPRLSKRGGRGNESSGPLPKRPPAFTAPAHDRFVGEPAFPRTARAFYWTWREAWFGNAQCQLLMARMYEVGYGVEQDLQEAMNWYGLAAEQGLEEAVVAHRALKEEGYVSSPPRPRPHVRGHGLSVEAGIPPLERKPKSRDEVGEWVGEWVR